MGKKIILTKYNALRECQMPKSKCQMADALRAVIDGCWFVGAIVGWASPTTIDPNPFARHSQDSSHPNHGSRRHLEIKMVGDAHPTGFAKLKRFLSFI
jgi:hypothetical protein